MPSVWHPSALLNGTATQPYAVIILNQPINKNALSAVIGSAVFLVCADGGADRLLHLERNHGFSTRRPDAIIGDLDSISEDAKSFYGTKGVKIIKDPDQYSTDQTKCLKWIRHEYNSTATVNGVLDIVILGGIGGRVDQGFSQVHHLYLAEQDKRLLRGRIYLLSEQSLTFVLDDGDNQIILEPGTFAENVGIIPVMGPTRISTKGLEWDVEDWLTEFGGNLSTSNHIRSDKIVLRVEGRRPLMTLELAQRFCMVY